MAETPRNPMMQPDAEDRSERSSGTHDHGVLTVFLAFLRLGLTSFGGPVAHLAYFRDEFVTRRHWMSERAYADLVGLCQFLPGPASSQVGLSLGLSRAGYAGALAAWVGFTLPSALAMILFAQGLSAWGTACRRACSMVSSWSPWQWWPRRSGAWRAACAQTRCA